MSEKKTKKFRPPMKTPLKRKQIEDNWSQSTKQFKFEVEVKPQDIQTIKPKDNKNMFVFDIANGKTSSVSSEKIKRMSKKFETFVDMETESGNEDNTRVVPDIKKTSVEVTNESPINTTKDVKTEETDDFDDELFIDDDFFDYF